MVRLKGNRETESLKRPELATNRKKNEKKMGDPQGGAGSGAASPLPTTNNNNCY